MPAGDASRVWFPEVVEALRQRWEPSLSVPALIALTGELDALLQQIRARRNILPPMMWCPRCQERHRQAPPRVGVRAVIVALSRFNIADEATAEALDREWRRYRKRERLDRFGEPKDESDKA